MTKWLRKRTPRKMFESNEYCCVPLRFSISKRNNENDKIHFHRFLFLARGKQWLIKNRRDKGPPFKVRNGIDFENTATFSISWLAGTVNAQPSLAFHLVAWPAVIYLIKNRQWWSIFLSIFVLSLSSLETSLSSAVSFDRVLEDK